jgi:hypothetical protein
VESVKEGEQKLEVYVKAKVLVEKRRRKKKS